MSDIYYYGNQPMLKYMSGGIPCATPIDKYAADLIESQQATITELTAENKTLRDYEKRRIYASPERFKQLWAAEAKVEELEAALKRLALLEANNFPHAKPYMVCVPTEIWEVAFPKQEVSDDNG